MIEQDWLEATDPRPMLEFLRTSGRPSDRNLRLWACGCVRRVWHLLELETSRQAVELTEQFVEGVTTAMELATAHDVAYRRVVAAAFSKPSSPTDYSWVLSYNADVAAAQAAYKPHRSL